MKGIRDRTRWFLLDRGLWSLAGSVLLAGALSIVFMSDSMGVRMRQESLSIPVTIVVLAVAATPILGALYPHTSDVEPRSRGTRMFELILWSALLWALGQHAVSVGLPGLASPALSALLVTALPIGLTLLTRRPIVGATTLLVLVFTVGMTRRDIYPAPSWSLLTSDQDASVKTASAGFVLALGALRYLR